MKLNLPNKLTLFRICSVPVYMIFIMFPIINDTWSRAIACAVFVLAVISDFLDGFIARKLNSVTDFGKLMDSIADKFMILGAFLAICSSESYKSVRWFVFVAAVIVLFRELAVTSLRLIAASSYEHIVISANWYGKIKTGTQCAAVITLIIEPIIIPAASGFGAFRWLSLIAIIIMCAATLYSGWYYFKEYKHLIFKDGQI